MNSIKQDNHEEGKNEGRDIKSHDFLVELGTEELPPKSLKTLSDSFTQQVTDQLEKSGISFGEVNPFATPRRLGLRIQNLAAAQADRQIEKRGPALRAAYDESGKPSKACEGFARSCNTTPDQLSTMETTKGAWVVYRSTQPGALISDLIPQVIEQALSNLPIPKRMRWGATQVEFVRPIHWLILLLDEQIINSRLYDQTASNSTRGHRFHHPDQLTIDHPKDYASRLASHGYVIADFNQRKEMIRQDIVEKAKTTGGHVVIDEDLLDEVTSLTEWPVALVGAFDERFLQVPSEALIYTMKGNQKYFHIEDNQKQLLPYFITVANIESKDVQQVISGNERVIRPRLEDAAFFYQTDQKIRLDQRVDKLREVIFQQQLGSLSDKSKRVALLAAKIACVVGSDEALAQRAGELSKTDLMTEMVLEFPELQGTMGRYYAQLDGEAAEVAAALEEQYLPRFSGDQLPASPTGAVLSIADKLDTLVGIFGISQAPTGTKDPFGLRRSALGLLRIIVEKELDLDLKTCIQWSVELYQDFEINTHELKETVLTYVLERFRAWYEDQHLPAEIFLSVMARRPSKPLEFHQRIQAVAAFTRLDEAARTLAAANKRVSNILSKEGISEPQPVRPELFSETLEIDLSNALTTIEKRIQPDIQQRNFTAALNQLVNLKEPIDAFFDGVMVMADDPEIRQNRIALLAQLRAVFLQIADISLLQQKG